MSGNDYGNAAQHYAPPPGIPADAPATSRVDTFLQRDVLEAAQFTDEDIDTILGAAGDPAASPAARAASRDADAQERRKIVEAAEIMYMRRQRASVAGIAKAMQRPGNPWFLPACPHGESSDRCPIARRLGFAVHYLWDNHSDQIMFGMRLSGGLGAPRYFVVQGAPPMDVQRNAAISPYDRHMAAVNATRVIAHELGLAPEAVVDTAHNRITIGQNTLVYCRLDEFKAWWAAQQQSDRALRNAKMDEYRAGLEAVGATKYVTPFVTTLGEIAEQKAFAQRQGSPFAGQVGGSRAQRVG